MTNSLNKTFLLTPNCNNRNWFIIDCQNQKLGRLANIITSLLKGKGKPDYFPSIDNGAYVILINANKIIRNKTGNHYIVNTPGRPGHSLKIKKINDCLHQFTIKQAVKGMLSQTEKKRLLRRLKIYNTQEHMHHAQKPIKFNIKNFYSNRTF